MNSTLVMNSNFNNKYSSFSSSVKSPKIHSYPRFISFIDGSYFLKIDSVQLGKKSFLYGQKSLNLLVQKEDDYFCVKNDDLSLYSVGSDFFGLYKDIENDLRILYKNYSSKSDDKLTENAIRIKRYFAENFIKIGD